MGNLVDRVTGEGTRITVGLSALGLPVAAIDGVAQGACIITELATPIERSGLTYTHTLGVVGLTAAEVATIAAAYSELPVVRREALRDACSAIRAEWQDARDALAFERAAEIEIRLVAAQQSLALAAAVRS